MIQLPDGISRQDLEAMIDLFNSWGEKRQTEGMIDAISHFLNVSGWRQRLMDAEAKLAELRQERADLARECNAFEAKLAELEKQEPAGKWIVRHSPTEDGYDRYSFASWRGNEPKNNTELFTRHAPAINLADLVPDSIEVEQVRGILDPTANPDEYACCVGMDMWNAACAAMLRNIEEQSK